MQMALGMEATRSDTIINSHGVGVKEKKCPGQL
jgi:hypothetical protein